MWYKTKITKLLGIKYPILLGPMGGGFSTVGLLTQVSDAGGLGSYGAYTLTPQQLLETGNEIKRKTTNPFNINLWVSDVDEHLARFSTAQLNKITGIFKPYFDELGIPVPDLSVDIPSKFESQVEAMFQVRPAVFSFIFGIPRKEILAECKKLGIKTIGAATTIDEAVALADANVDAIVAAGSEAGGHRPSFLKPAGQSLTSLPQLVQQIKSNIKIPIIAAGGIADAKGISTALSWGADAVQLGTAFLACDESGATPLHRHMLFSGGSENTVLSKSLTGRLGRMINNRIAQEVQPGTSVLPFPLQLRLLAPLKAAALLQGKTELVNFWSGANSVQLQHTNATTLMQSLVTEMNRVNNNGL